MSQRVEYKSEKYKHVYKVKKESSDSLFVWWASVAGVCKNFKDEREAAKWVDMRLISKGKDPVNVLVQK